MVVRICGRGDRFGCGCPAIRRRRVGRGRRCGFAHGRGKRRVGWRFPHGCRDRCAVSGFRRDVLRCDRHIRGQTGRDILCRSVCGRIPRVCGRTSLSAKWAVLGAVRDQFSTRNTIHLSSLPFRSTSVVSEAAPRYRTCGAPAVRVQKTGDDVRNCAAFPKVIVRKCVGLFESPIKRAKNI